MCIFRTIFAQLETRTKESKRACKFLESLPRLEPAAMLGELWFACEGTGVSTGGRAHSSPLFFCSTDQGVQHVSQGFFPGMLGSVHDGQPTVILRVCAMKKVNAWICARPTTHHVLARVILEKKLLLRPSWSQVLTLQTRKL